MKILVPVKICDGELNPFDGAALECALAVPGAEITVLSMCPPSAEGPLSALTRLGKMRVILLSDRAFAGSDTLATSYILTTAAKKIGFDAVFCGRQTVDGDTGQVGPCLAAMLGIPALTNVMRQPDFSRCGSVHVHTRFGEEGATLPALLTFERIAVLRAPSIFSRLSPIEKWDNTELRADPARCGLTGSPTRVLSVTENERGRRKCRFITKEELVPLVRSLAGQGGAAEEWQPSEKRLPLVCIIGDRLLKRAQALSDRVEIIDSRDPEEIIRCVQLFSPDAVLWQADLWGRRTAPRLSAALGCGLCADCTGLETDGETLFMYRPARSGNVIAKIKCLGKPQTATVRCPDNSAGDIILSCGRGVSESIDKARALAFALGAELCASRALVDEGVMPYEAQVGLTGRTVSPSVYIALGISGAVRHCCAIENSGTVIAWNPDRNARIFEYADYGIAEPFTGIE